MKVVIDTNVIVSGLLTPFGKPADIVRMIAAGALILCLDSRILSEYEDVLLRPKFKFDKKNILSFLEQIEKCGYAIASNPLMRCLPDPDDEPFLEVCIASKAKCLVTGNIKHFPLELRFGVNVFSPEEFLDFYRNKT